MVLPELDNSHKISTTQYIELPFWIPIKSGEYEFPKNQKIEVRNDLWLVTTGNIVDGELNDQFEFIVDETQIANREYLHEITKGKAKYHHKSKMKTTIIRNYTHIPFKGSITEEAGSDAWKNQIRETMRGAGLQIHQDLALINQFIEYYSCLVHMNEQTEEMRRVSSYETMVRYIVHVEKDGIEYSYPSTFVTDIRMVNLPFPLHRVQDSKDLAKLAEVLKNLEAPSFHQLQWIRTLNHLRERRYQEALLSASQTLEALVYSFLALGNLTREDIQALLRKSKGIAGWVGDLVQDLKDYYQTINPKRSFDYLSREICESAAKLWKLRNEIVHGQRILTKSDYHTTRIGIEHLGRLRRYFLNSINPELLKLEKMFSKFLEDIPLGFDKMEILVSTVSIPYQWRRESDNYEKSVSSPDVK